MLWFLSIILYGVPGIQESTSQWASALEARLEECAALIAQVDYTVAHPNY